MRNTSIMAMAIKCGFVGRGGWALGRHGVPGTAIWAAPCPLGRCRFGGMRKWMRGRVGDCFRRFIW